VEASDIGEHHDHAFVCVCVCVRVCVRVSQVDTLGVWFTFVNFEVKRAGEHHNLSLSELKSQADISRTQVGRERERVCVCERERESV